ncbi:transcriptional regulator [Rhodococcus qingshengii]|uniref:helix-turn-helix domain-containing protein n=1 Tax=Rhodococcus TaxID=1827 RepID=UPI000C9FE60B|nr:helix-turn-helix transcriptional regulator [Rhodococcus qingshengii]AUS34642.1 transcriptional regulator [Rhodococcus qingshengii]
MAQGARSADEYTAAVADELRAARIEQGMTQMQLAETSGIPRSTISKILAGGQPIDLSELRAICTALGLSAVQVMQSAERRLGL